MGRRLGGGGVCALFRCMITDGGPQHMQIHGLFAISVLSMTADLQTELALHVP